MAKPRMNFVDVITLILLAIGGINWGLGIWNINLVAIVFGSGIFADIVYGLIGLSGLYSLWFIVKHLLHHHF
jgi:uncharacterized membrane protein YuzA (DUF378 family)